MNKSWPSGWTEAKKSDDKVYWKKSDIWKIGYMNIATIKYECPNERCSLLWQIERQHTSKNGLGHLSHLIETNRMPAVSTKNCPSEADSLTSLSMRHSTCMRCNYVFVCFGFGLKNICRAWFPDKLFVCVWFFSQCFVGRLVVVIQCGWMSSVLCRYVCCVVCRPVIISLCALRSMSPAFILTRLPGNRNLYPRIPTAEMLCVCVCRRIDSSSDDHSIS